MRGRRLVLGYDAGCAAYGALARRIEEAVGERLEVRSLYDPQVDHWREQVLGKDAPWAPTLVEAGNNGEVRGWTGLRMVIMLSRSLGLSDTWKIMRILGDMGAACEGSDLSTGRGVDGMSRGQFLRGLGGAALVFGVLGMASPAYAARSEIDQQALVDTFSAVEDLPDSVVVQGEKATREWLSNRLGVDAELAGIYQPQGIFGCASAIGVALVSNAIGIAKILKIRAAIRAVGGAYRFARIIVNAYRVARGRGLGRLAAIRYAARRAAIVSGEDVYGPLLALFSLGSVVDACF
ncbi:MAG: hypothetical protein IRY88_16630 [Rubrobacteraceae bacterium]|nr:hypothetical protein [Rubrobacteraceae bacterium]